MIRRIQYLLKCCGLEGGVVFDLACVAGGVSEQLSFGGGAAILFPRRREEMKFAAKTKAYFILVGL